MLQPHLSDDLVVMTYCLIIDNSCKSVKLSVFDILETTSIQNSIWSN